MGGECECGMTIKHHPTPVECVVVWVKVRVCVRLDEPTYRIYAPDEMSYMYKLTD